ncbi:hypothetical protein [Staphylococcus aureus]|uniref:hypothetical protein n=1 Tax=Staphylococcus aureus TaxID=1280 RepID=UPI001F1AAF21|nr:hypothetical protein [Staphylococcus aureus]
MSTLGFIDINKAPFKVFIFSMSTLKGAFHKAYLSIRFSYKTKKATVLWLFVLFSIKMVSIAISGS